MSVFIEAIYEGGMLRPLVSYHFTEHKRYRLMLMEEISTSELPNHTAMAEEIARRTITLPDGRSMINVQGLFAYSKVDLDYDDIEATLNEFRQEQAREWGKDTQENP